MSWFGYPLVGGVMNAVAAGVGAFFGGVGSFYSFMPRLPCYTQAMNCFSAGCHTNHAATCPYYANPAYQPRPPQFGPSTRSQLTREQAQNSYNNQKKAPSSFHPNTQESTLARWQQEKTALEAQIKRLENLLLEAETRRTKRSSLSEF